MTVGVTVMTVKPVILTDFVDLLHYRFYGGKCDFILAREECDKENDANHYPDNINV